MTIENISDTARWVAWYRAMESERGDAVFRDPYAARLAGDRGREITAAIPKGRQMAWPMIVRTAVIDELLRQRLATGGVDTVVNLAAGLDARPWRLDLPPALRWVDVDLPDILRYKAEQLKGETPRCAYEAVSADLTDVAVRRDVLATAGTSAREAVIITEGLLVYLTDDAVQSLATALHAQPPFRWWIIDLITPRLLKMMEKSWGTALSAGNAPMRFAPAEGTGFFLGSGWREAEFRSTWEEAHRLHREMPMAWLWRLLGTLYPKRMQEEFRRMSGVVLLERT